MSEEKKLTQHQIRAQIAVARAWMNVPDFKGESVEGLNISCRMLSKLALDRQDALEKLQAKHERVLVNVRNMSRTLQSRRYTEKTKRFSELLRIAEQLTFAAGALTGKTEDHFWLRMKHEDYQEFARWKREQGSKATNLCETCGEHEAALLRLHCTACKKPFALSILLGEHVEKDHPELLDVVAPDYALIVHDFPKDACPDCGDTGIVKPLMENSAETCSISPCPTCGLSAK
jgi:hypothetical protein